MKKLFSLALVLLLVLNLQAKDNGQFFKKLSGQHVSVENIEQRFGEWFSLPEGTEWREVSRTTDFIGMERIEYREYVSGVEVEHSQVLIHAKDGMVNSANGMVMESRRSPARLRQRRPLYKTDNAEDGRQLLLVNTNEGFRYAYKELSADKKAWVYYDAETLEEIYRVSLRHRLSADEGTPVQVSASSLYSGTVTLDASKAADGSTYLYDATRNIHTLNAAYLPTFDELNDLNKIWDYFPRGNMPEDYSEATPEQLKEWEDYIENQANEDKLEHLTQYILDYSKYITNKPDAEYSAYKINKLTVSNLTVKDEDGNLKPYTPKAEEDIPNPGVGSDDDLELGNDDEGDDDDEDDDEGDDEGDESGDDEGDKDEGNEESAPTVKFRINYGVEPDAISKAIVTENEIDMDYVHAFPYTYSTASFISHLPSIGGTLYVLSPIEDDEDEEKEDSTEDLFRKMTFEDDEDEDDKEPNYDTLAVVKIVPNETGRLEFSNDRISFVIEYEKVGDPVADIHWGMAKTLDFYKEVFDRNSYDGKGSPVYNLIYNLDEHQNAMLAAEALNSGAISSNAPYPMLYGLGGCTIMESMNPVVELSVMAHEFTHIITEQTAKLVYKDESGALNESFSDIFGISVKKYWKNSKDWYIGEQLMLNSKLNLYSNMRDMANPKNSMDGNSPSPDTYKGKNWVVPETDKDDNGGVHTNSSVQNKWFYLITDGDKGTNDNGDNYDVEGIGIEKSRKIAYLTLTSYATEESDYSAIRKASEEATEALYGTQSKELQSVAKAWDAVGVEGSHLTSIEKMFVNEAQAGRIFDLQGRALTELIYIVDGKKVIVK